VLHKGTTLGVIGSNGHQIDRTLRLGQQNMIGDRVRGDPAAVLTPERVPILRGNTPDFG
jgi:hypothetical protein